MFSSPLYRTDNTVVQITTKTVLTTIVTYKFCLYSVKCTKFPGQTNAVILLNELQLAIGIDLFDAKAVQNDTLSLLRCSNNSSIDLN